MRFRPTHRIYGRAGEVGVNVMLTSRPATGATPEGGPAYTVGEWMSGSGASLERREGIWLCDARQIEGRTADLYYVTHDLYVDIRYGMKPHTWEELGLLVARWPDASIRDDFGCIQIKVSDGDWEDFATMAKVVAT